MVTAELAVAIPALVLVLAMCLAALRAAIDQIRCVDAARVAARSAARGDDPARVRWLAVASAPDGASVSVVGSSTVEVTVTARTGGWGGVVPAWTLSASAVAPAESADPP
jgi:hypothetical protein